MKFRFPIAILHYVKEGQMDMAVEKARDWAISDKRPTLTQAEAWINKIIEDDKKKQEEKELV